MATRRLIKRLAFGLCQLLVFPVVLLAWCEKRFGSGEALFGCGSQFLAMMPGLAGSYLRAAYYHASLDQCDWEVHVGFGSIFTHRGASLGAHASMGAYCVIGHADIGEDVMMASRISIPSGKRQHIGSDGRLTSIPRFERVTVGRGTWVGEGAIIMADVGERCIVSAGAVVSRKAPSACLVAGNPAEVIKALAPDVDARSS
jgi:virginiamycin A acetyltransferase